ncbi:MAG: hypothetical protein R3B51_02450 [Thermodesulfobacteriota bacterium]
MDTAKDVSMAGLIGSVLMLLESSGKGADINVESYRGPSKRRSANGCWRSYTGSSSL